MATICSEKQLLRSQDVDVDIKVMPFVLEDPAERCVLLWFGLVAVIIPRGSDASQLYNWDRQWEVMT